ncbi:MAG: hypothetical protein R2807_02860 [Chitinophagales bacterium]
MKQALLVFFIAIGLLANAKGFKGKWAGIGDQIDGQSWDIVLHFQDENNISIQYPSLGCSGSWMFQKTENNVNIFIENITMGIGKCDQGAEVHLQKLNRKEIKVVYYLRSYDADKPIAEGTLHKQRK